MKKKFLTFLFAICLILPCAFMLTACGKNPPDEPISLVGKEVVIECSDEAMEWSEFTFTASYYDDGYTYFLSLTAEEAINQTEYFNGLELVKAFTGNQNISSSSEAKTAMEAKIKSLVLEGMPKLAFHNQEKQVATYSHSGNLIKTYNYEVERNSYGNDLYTIKDESNETVGQLQVSGSSISTVGTVGFGSIFYWDSEPELDYNLQITLPIAGGATDGEPKVTTFNDAKTGAHFSFGYNNYKYVVAE